MLQQFFAVVAATSIFAGSVKGQDSESINYMSIQMTEAEHLNDLPDLLHLIQNLGLNSLYTMVVEAGLAKALSTNGTYTLFGPTDQAFSKIPEWLKKVIQDKKALAAVLEYHVLSQKLTFDEVKDENSIKTLNGKPIRFNIYPNNGVVTAQCSPLNQNQKDQMASNGVLHELGSVMIPPIGNIVKTISSCPVLKTLVSTVKAAGLLKVLSDEGPFTVFTPTESAWSKVDPKILDYLLKNRTALTEVLLYHVANLTYCSAGLVSYTNLTMLNGQNTAIAVDGDKIKVNSATVLEGGADGSVTNGVVHAVDTVLFPSSFPLKFRSISHNSDLIYTAEELVNEELFN